MSLQWTLVAGFLYAEMVVVVIMMLPIFSAKMWQRLFKSRFLKSLAAYANFYFSAFFVILLLLFLDSLRQMHKYSVARENEQDHGHLDAELQQSMKMFRAQRNCYIAGFALFLAPVIRRIGSLLSQKAQLMASVEASMKQAKSASETAEKLMKDREANGAGDNEANSKKEELETEIRCLKETLHSTKEELDRTKRNLTTLKDQAEGTNREYDRLLQEHEKLQKKLGDIQGEGKKDE